MFRQVIGRRRKAYLTEVGRENHGLRTHFANDIRHVGHAELRLAIDRLLSKRGHVHQFEERPGELDDMILRAASVLKDNPELKYSLADRYNYIMLDEFQDTNPAQFQLVKLLTDHPVHEGRPNILAVGDDDQAI